MSYATFPNVPFSIPIILDLPDNNLKFYQMCFKKKNYCHKCNLGISNINGDICPHIYEEMAKYDKSIYIYKKPESLSDFRLSDFIKYMDYHCFIPDEDDSIKLPNLPSSILVITKNQAVDEHAVEIMKHFSTVIFTNYSGHVSTKIPPNVETIIIYSNRKHNVLEMLQEGVKYLFIHQFAHDSITDIVPVNINNLPDSIITLDINTLVESIKRFPLSTTLLTFNERAQIESDLTVFPPNVIMVAMKCSKIKNYSGFPNSLKIYYGDVNSYVPSDLPMGLERFYHMGEMIVDDFKKIPDSVLKMIIKCDIYDAPVKLPKCLEDLSFDMDGFVFIDEYPPNLKNMEINIAFMKYVDINKFPVSLKNITFLAQTEPSWETDDEFYENIYNVKIKEKLIEDETHDVQPRKRSRSCKKSIDLKYGRVYKSYECMDHLVDDDETPSTKYKELKEKYRHQFRDSILAELTKMEIEYDLEEW